MKKILIIALIVLFCAVGALGVFIATFDANRYAPQVVQKASEALKRPVHLGRLSLIWKNGIALRLQDLIVYADAEKTSKAIQVQDISAVVRLMPLLHKDIQIAAISVIKPSIHLIKNPDGSVQVSGIKTPPTSSNPRDSSAAGAAAPLLSVDSFMVQDGAVFLEDRSAAEPLSVSVSDLDVKVKNFSLTRPFSFDVAAAVFGDKQNIRVNGSMLLPNGKQKGYLQKTALQAGLADLDLAQIQKAVPGLRSAGLEGNLGGKLEVQIEHADLDPAALNSLKATLRLQNAAFKLKNLDSPLESVQLTAGVAGGDLSIENFSANFAKGTLKASAEIQRFMTQAVLDFKGSAQDLAIDELIPSAGGNRPHLSGRASIDFNGKASGFQGPQLSQTLSGQGRFRLKDGVLLNYNLLREVIQKLSIIPGAEGVLQQQLPNFYKAKMGEPSTLFQPVDLPFSVQNGVFQFDRLLLVTDVMSLEGSGQVGLDKNVQARSTLRLSPDLSGAIVGIVPQIQILTGPRGEIEIPMQVQGQFPHLMVFPDKEYITQKLLSSQAQQVVVGLIKDPSKGINTVRNFLDKPASAGEAGIQDSFKKLLGQTVSGQDNTGGQQQ